MGKLDCLSTSNLLNWRPVIVSLFALKVFLLPSDHYIACDKFSQKTACGRPVATKSINLRRFVVVDHRFQIEAKYLSTHLRNHTELLDNVELHGLSSFPSHGIQVVPLNIAQYSWLTTRAIVGISAGMSGV
ncbi:hypothetical protein J6590_052314 [Homalodisca vitripennis]|nr:hypothetical protein J6590_052314 [Homalodisca vitripennis]